MTCHQHLPLPFNHCPVLPPAAYRPTVFLLPAFSILSTEALSYTSAKRRWFVRYSNSDMLHWQEDPSLSGKVVASCDRYWTVSVHPTRNPLAGGRRVNHTLAFSSRHNIPPAPVTVFVQLSSQHSHYQCCNQQPCSSAPNAPSSGVVNVDIIGRGRICCVNIHFHCKGFAIKPWQLHRVRAQFTFQETIVIQRSEVQGRAASSHDRTR